MSGEQPRLSTDPLGYWLATEFREGFPDDPSLPTGARRRVAAWCRRYTPEQMTDAHRAALAAPFDGQISDVQREAERLGSLREDLAQFPAPELGDPWAARNEQDTDR